ncbi:hypothetical protein GA0115255_127313, partial [Streptomyces sp. Ncost-T6T-2b]
MTEQGGRVRDTGGRWEGDGSRGRFGVRCDDPYRGGQGQLPCPVGTADHQPGTALGDDLSGTSVPSEGSSGTAAHP